MIFLQVELIIYSNNRMSSQSFRRNKAGNHRDEEDAEFTARIRGPPMENRSKYSKWTQKENMLYLEFLQANLEDHNTTFDRRPAGYFAKMAQFLRNGRSKEQCRSHHQKLLLKYKSPEQIISVLQESIEKTLDSQQGRDKTQIESEISENIPLIFSRKQSLVTEIEMKMIDEQSVEKEVKDLLFDLQDNDVLLSLIY